MKHLTFLSLLVALVLTSCGGDDSIPPGQEQRAYDVVFSGITVGANYNVTTPSQSKRLDEVLSSSNKDKVPYVKEATIQYGESWVLIEGLKQGESLAGLTFNLLDGQAIAGTVSLGRIEAGVDGAPVKNSTNNFLTFLNTVATNLAAKKSMTLQITLNGGDKDVTNLKITVHTTAIFKW